MKQDMDKIMEKINADIDTLQVDFNSATHTQTFIAGLRQDGLTAPWVIDGAINRALFNAYIETQLLAALETAGRGDPRQSLEP